MPRFKQTPQHPSQVILFTRSVDESIPTDSNVRMLCETMDMLDWSGILSSYSEDSARVAAEVGLVFLNAVSIDGSKVRSVASRKAIYNQNRIERERASIERVLRDAGAAGK